MPVVRVTWFEGKDTPTKQEVAAEITESIVRNTSYPVFSPIKATINCWQ